MQIFIPTKAASTHFIKKTGASGFQTLQNILAAANPTANIWARGGLSS